MKYNDPLSQATLTGLFRTSPDDPFRIINREGNKIEFKTSYNNANMAQYFKTMASFANKDGGYILFGVGEKPRRLIGLNGKSLEQFENLNVELFTQNINDYFSPEIMWDHCTFTFKGLKFGVIYTFPSRNKPCVCNKNHDENDSKYKLKDGDIYYRYSGRSERIKSSELQAIINESRKQEEQRWLEFLKNAARIGSENAALLDLNSGSLTGSGGTIILDEKLLEKVKFVKEGQFVEKEGAPTLKLIGEASINTGKVVIQEHERKTVTAIEPQNIIMAFLAGEKVENPLEYIKCICSELSANYPVYYYIELSGLNNSEIMEMIENTTARGSGKKNLIKRLAGKTVDRNGSIFSATPAGRSIKRYYDSWINESIPNDITDLSHCLNAFLRLTDDEIIKHEKYLKETTLKLFEKYYENATANQASDIRKCICRLDEVLHFNKD